jgi:aminopeptidase N
LFREFPQTLDFWESRIGPYPWADQKMGVIRVPHSGLENQTLIGHSNDFPKTVYGWDWLMNHEFAHEWFGNQMSVANYDDLWLHEGFGSYAQPLLAEHLGGLIDYMAQLKAPSKRSTLTRAVRAATFTPRAVGSRTRCASRSAMRPSSKRSAFSCMAGPIRAQVTSSPSTAPRKGFSASSTT